jgi:hypothetical protein
MLSDDESQKESMEALKGSLEEKIAGTELEGLVRFGVSKNPTGGALADFIEAVGQRINTETAEAWRDLGNTEGMRESSKAIYLEISKKHEMGGIDFNPYTQNHIELYKAELGEGQKVIVVGHSQGNSFTNQAYYGISDDLRP